MFKKNNKDWSHSLFKRSYFFKRYGFIEAAVILFCGISVICLAAKEEDFKVKNFSGLSMYFGIWKDPEKLLSIVVGLIHLSFSILAILINIYKRFRVCSSLSCYLGETDAEKFKKERKMLNMATGVSTVGVAFAVPAIYFLSFLFRIIFIRFIRKEEKSCGCKDNIHNH